MTAPVYPSLYQINTRVWLTELTAKPDRSATLDDIPDSELDRLAQLGFEWIWFLTVWQTGAAGKHLSQTNPAWVNEFRETLPDLTAKDIPGSGFAITAYTVHTDLGGDEALARLRGRMQQRGLKLMLDFVPNHTALDHQWVQTHPGYFIRGNESLLAGEPLNYTKLKTASGDIILAHGRDPYFTGWIDTLQLNYSESGVQQAMMNVLLKIAGQCDGLRCDMAMLLQPEVFAKTWGLVAQPFWPEAIRGVKGQHPGFCFMAEVYWDYEWTLQQEGFDYTYDKRLYDRLKEGRAKGVHDHFKADPSYQEKMARFLENHDEGRAAAEFGDDQHEAAAIISFLSTGLRFFHQGQLEGKKKRISPHLGRGPIEPPNERLKTFYARLLEVLHRPIFQMGHWALIGSSPAWEGNGSHENYIGFSWEWEGRKALVAVNYSPVQSQCYLHLSFNDLCNRTWLLKDSFSDAIYERSGDELASKGIYLDEQGWKYYVLELEEK